MIVVLCQGQSPAGAGFMFGSDTNPEPVRVINNEALVLSYFASHLASRNDANCIRLHMMLGLKYNGVPDCINEDEDDDVIYNATQTEINKYRMM